MSIFGNNKKYIDKFVKEIRNRIMMKFLSIIPTGLFVKHSVTFHDGSKGYRDVPLALSDCVLEKKK